MACDRVTSCASMCDSCASSSVFGWGSCDCGDDGCSGGCGSQCSGKCDGTCKTTCKDNCGRACNVQCSDVASINLYEAAMTTLNKKILASDINNIRKLIAFEAERRAKTAKATDMQVKTLVTDTKIKTLITDLQDIGQTVDINIDNKIKCKKSDIKKLQDIVEKSYLTEVK